jgi:hypothetical protein
MRLQRLRFPVLFVAVLFSGAAGGQSPPAQGSSPSPPQAQVLAQKQATVTISLDDAIQMALQHNHNLLALRTTIQQNQAEEISAPTRSFSAIGSSCRFFNRANLTPTISTTPPSSIWASATCLSAAKSGNTA